MEKSRIKVLTLPMMALVLVLASCGSKAASTSSASSQPPATSTPPVTAVPALTVNVSSKTGLGNFLVDGKGMTLYWTTRDAAGQSNITGTTLANWPVFYVSTITVPSSLSAADFGSITRADGAKQTTYKGWPLYYYLKDTVAGDTAGQAVANVWFVVDPATSAPVALPATTTAPATSTPASSSTPPTASSGDGM